MQTDSNQITPPLLCSTLISSRLFSCCVSRHIRNTTNGII